MHRGLVLLVLTKRYANPVLYFADPLALPLTAYKYIFSRLQQWTDLYMMMDIMEHRGDIQPPPPPCNQQTRKCVVHLHLYCS